MSLIWVLEAAIWWVDIVPGNLAALNDSRRELSGGDARRGILLATIGVAVPLAQVALATAVLSGSRRAVAAAVIWLVPLAGLTAWTLSWGISAMTVFNLTSVVASFALLSRALLIEWHSGVFVPTD